MNIVSIAVLFLLQLYMFFAFGALLLRVCGKKTQSLGMTYLIGFFYYFIFFAVFALPMIFTHKPLSLLTHIWLGFAGLVMLISTVVNIRDWKKQVQKIPAKVKAHGWVFPVLAAVILLQMLFVFTHMDSTADASYYIGKVTTDVYTNTMGHFDPYSGEKLLRLDEKRAIACFPEYNAVIAQFTGLHPLKQAKLIMPEIIILTVNLLYYRIGMLLFENDRKKTGALLFFIFCINLYSQTIYTSSAFLLTRTYEGKAILANLILPGLLYAFLLLWKKGHTGKCKLLLLGISVSSCIFSSSSMLIVPVGLTAGFLPWVLREKKFSSLGWYLLYIAPNLAVCVLYLLVSKGHLIYTIQ